MADVAALLAEADAAYHSSNWDGALESYTKALEADPNSAVACRRRADVLAIRGRFADVLEAYFRLIDILESQDDLDGALEVAHWVMNLKPDSDQARMKMIFAYHKKGDLKEVVRQSRELAKLYIDLGQGDQSIALLQQAQKADPDNLEIGLELAEMYVSHGHIQDGANQYRKVANAFLEQRNSEKAAEAFRRMKVIVPDDPTVLLTLGNLYVDLKRYNEAEQEYRSILRHNLNHEEALLALGRVCQLKKQFRDAILAFNRILSINPEEVTAKEKLGELYQAQGLTSESIKNYLAAAQSYLEFEEREKAIRLFQIVLGLDPANPTACRELTNLGAPLVGIRNEELEPPPEPVAEVKADNIDDGEKGRPGWRRGEEEGGKVRSGLLRPNDGGTQSKLASKSGLLSSKPKLGEGKPSLGGPGGPRKGLLRPGISGGAGDKPMLLRRGQEVAEQEGADESSIETSSGELSMGRGSVVSEPPAPIYVAPQDDPFPGALDPFDTSGHAQDPFGETNDPFAHSGSADPFGGSPTGGYAADPFTTSQSADPFAPTGQAAEAFGAPVGHAADPFAHADPFAPATHEPDPFGGIKRGADPFAAADPFAGHAAADPFAGHAAADPFAGHATADPFAGHATADPFAGHAAAEPFADSHTADPFVGHAAADPFATASAPDLFANAGHVPDPFALAGHASDPFASVGHAADPFAAPDSFAVTGQALDPFTAVETPISGFGTEDPFASAGHVGEAFGANAAPDLFNTVGQAVDPFAPPVAEADPFGAGAPFAAQVTGRGETLAPADPFANAAQFGADPFSASPEVDNFAANVSFGTFAAVADPFGAAEHHHEQTVDPFASTLSPAQSVGAAQASQDLFATGDPGHDPFAPSGTFGEGAELFATQVDTPSSGYHPSATEPAAEQPYGNGERPGEAVDPFAVGMVVDPFLQSSNTGHDPFATTTDPFAHQESTLDPFGGSMDPFAASAIPHSSAELDPHDPFATVAPADPFRAADSTFAAAAEADPFGSLTTDVDPFAAAPTQDPFVSATAYDPFASATPVQDPFAAGDPFASGDPFAASPAVDPFATTTAQKSANASLADPFGEVELDPFAPAPSVKDPFGAGVTALDPFAAATVDDPFLNADNLNLAAEAVSFVPSESSFGGTFPTTGPVSAVAHEPSVEPESEDPFLVDPFSETRGEQTSHGSPKGWGSDGHDAPFVSSPSREQHQAIADATPVQVIEAPVLEEVRAEALPENPAPAPAAKNRASLSLEDESSPAHVNQAHQLRETHKEADVATLIRAYRKSIEDSPDNLLLRAELADLHLRYGLLEDAVVQYRQILKRNPQSLGLHHRLISAHLWNDNYDDAAATLMELANLHVERGEQLEALEALQSILSLEPHHFQARRAMVERFTALQDSKLVAYHLRQLAESALTKGNLDEAIPAFKQLMEISDDPSLEDRLAQVYESQGDKALALQHYGRLAQRYRNDGRIEEAAAVTERIVGLAPDDLSIRGDLVELYSKLGMSDKVLAQRYQLACFYHGQGKAREAMTLLEQVLQEKSDHHDARRFLIESYIDNGRLDDALRQTPSLTEHYFSVRDHEGGIALYSKLINAQPNDTQTRQTLIRFYEMAQDSENAAEQWLFLAQLHSRESNWESAVQAYNKILELDESRVEIHYQLALIYLDKIPSPVEAIKRFHRVYELNPGHTEAMSKYIRMLLRVAKSEGAAKVLLKLEQSNPEGAAVRKNVLTDFRSRIEAEPADLKARFVYGELCFHLGELDLGIEQFQQTRRDPHFELKSFNMLGLCFAEKPGYNMLDLAIKQFRKGLETSGHSEQEYLELRYNLAMLQYRNNRLQEALQELKDCYAVDIAYRDVREWIRRIEAEIAGGPKVARLFPREK